MIKNYKKYIDFYLRESFFTTGKVSTGEIVEIYKNPSLSEIDELLSDFIRDNEMDREEVEKDLRGFVYNNGDILVWHGNIIHKFITNAFKLDMKDFLITLIFNSTKQTIRGDYYIHPSLKNIGKKLNDNFFNNIRKISSYKYFEIYDPVVPSDNPKDENRWFKYDITTNEKTYFYKE